MPLWIQYPLGRALSKVDQYLVLRPIELKTSHTLTLLRLKTVLYRCPVISFQNFGIRVLPLCRLKEITSTCGRLATVKTLRDFEMLMNKDRWLRNHTSRNETRGSVYFILLYSVTVPLKHVFKMAAFGLYTQSGPFSAPREMGVPHHVGSNCDFARAFVCACVSFF